MSFNVGETVGPYRIIEQLGQGGMATVFKAYHAALDRYVALKVLHPAFHEDKTFIARFQREARVVAKLEHPNIVPIYDYAEHENRPYLVMKFIEGETLKSRLSRGPLTADEIARVVDSAGSALAYAHKQGILHRDIKPSNVLIATDGSMYLADFGLARIAQAGESTLSSDSIMGTPQYISPEQAMGKKDLDEGTDIYSFGVMLYEMVVGQVPFSADTPFSIIHDHIYTPLPLPMEVNPKVPEPVQRVLLKSLAKDRMDRYKTVQEMLKAFREAWSEAGVPMEGTAITMHPAVLKEAGTKAEKVESAAKTVAAKAVPKKKRSPWLYAAGSAVLVFCCLFAFAAFRQGGFFPDSRRPLSVTPTTAAVPTRTPEPIPTAEPKPTLIASPEDVSPEVRAARELVSNNPNDPDTHLQLALALWDAGQPRAALEELTQAANLADPTNPEFFIKAAEKFKQREAWVAVAGMYLRAVQTFPAGEVPEDLFNQFSEAVYKASAFPDMPLFIFFERIDRVDQPLGFIARGRNSLYNNDPEAAKLHLENAKRLKPGYYEAFLLESEIDVKTGHPDEAKAILLSLSSDLGAPAWIRLMAEAHLKSIP
jgi:tRNA A-37 threonylcarbamoyl transferase component Bud32/tetratricopeptide (TPR) repeat protein